jgi:hypothetical protein
VRQVFAAENHPRRLSPIKPQTVLRRRAGASAKREGAEVSHLLSLRTFVSLEAQHSLTGMSIYAAKTDLTREAIRLYLRQPTIILKAIA